MISRAGPFLVRRRVRRVPVLERHEVRGVLGERARHLDRAVRALVAVGEDDLGAEQPEEAEPLLARVVGEDHGEVVALALGDHREGDPRVPGGRLEDRLVGRELAGCLGGLDHRERDPVLRGAGRVVPLELGPQAHAGASGTSPAARRAACSRSRRGCRRGGSRPAIIPAACCRGAVGLGAASGYAGRGAPEPQPTLRTKWYANVCPPYVSGSHVGLGLERRSRPSRVRRNRKVVGNASACTRFQ